MLRLVKKVAEIKWKTKTEIDNEINKNFQPNLTDRLEAIELAVLDLIMEGVMMQNVSISFEHVDHEKSH